MIYNLDDKKLGTKFMQNRISYTLSAITLLMGILFSDKLSLIKPLYGNLILMLSILLSIFIFLSTDKGKELLFFLKNCKNELKHIEWVKKDELNKMTIISILIIFITTIVVLFFDTVIFKVISMFLY